MAENFHEVELLHCGVAVFNHPVLCVPAGISGGSSTVAVATGVERFRGVKRWEGIDWARGKGRCRWCALDELEEDR